MLPGCDHTTGSVHALGWAALVLYSPWVLPPESAYSCMIVVQFVPPLADTANVTPVLAGRLQYACAITSVTLLDVEDGVEVAMALAAYVDAL